MLWGIRNVLLEGDKQGCIVVEEGKIYGSYADNEQIPDGVAWYDGMGLELYPAMINLHVHDRPDQLEKEDVEHLEAACIEGGVGTIGPMPNTREGFKYYDDQFEFMHGRWKGSKITVVNHIGAANDNIQHLRTLTHSRCDARLGEIKMFMEPSTNPSMLIHEPQKQREVMEAAGEVDRIVMVHAGVVETIKRNELRFEGTPKKHFHHCLIRNSSIEVEGVRRILEINREVGCDLHICHVSNYQTIRLINEAKSRGQRVTCESDPKYWRLNLTKLIREGGRGQVLPSLRTAIEALQMEKAVCAGEVDSIFDDHAPHLKHEKQEPYGKSPSGLTGVQTTFQLTYELKRSGKISPQRFVDITSRNAARRFRLNKGELQAGYDADFVLFNPNGQTTFSDETTKSKAGWTPYDGVTIFSTIDLCVFSGKIVKGLLRKFAT